jgi:hypothetical protein
MFNKLTQRFGSSSHYTNISESSGQGQSGDDSKKFSYLERNYLRSESDRIRETIAAMGKTLDNIGSVGNSSQIPSQLRSSEIASELKKLPSYIERAYGMTALPEFSKDYKVTLEQQRNLIQSLNRRIEDLYHVARKLKDRTGDESYDISKIARSAFKEPHAHISEFLTLSGAIEILDTAYRKNLENNTLTNDVLNQVEIRFKALKSKATDLSTRVHYAGRDVVMQFKAPHREELEALKAKFSGFEQKLDEQRKKVTANELSAAGKRLANLTLGGEDRGLGRGRGL